MIVNEIYNQCLKWVALNYFIWMCWCSPIISALGTPRKEPKVILGAQWDQRQKSLEGEKKDEEGGTRLERKLAEDKREGYKKREEKRVHYNYICNTHTHTHICMCVWLNAGRHRIKPLALEGIQYHLHLTGDIVRKYKKITQTVTRKHSFLFNLYLLTWNYKRYWSTCQFSGVNKDICHH